MSYRRIKAKYDGKIAGLYDLEGTIGKGHYAVVKLARHVFTGEKVAVKVIDKTKLDEVSRAHLFQEVRCMKLVQHPNIVRLYEVIDTQSKLYLILELGDGGDLYDYIMKHDGGLEEPVAKTYFHQIVEAIAYCHQLHVVHRDLKPENVVFFDKTGSVKLTDFGFSNKFIPGRKLETSCGSLAYSAPEILLGDSYDPPAVDVWSLGVILYMLVCGKPPFQEANDGETLIKIMDCSYTIPSHVSSTCQHLISRMLVREPNERISLERILVHPWLNEGVALTQAPRPLVCRETLSDDEHSCIVQKIVDGKIASRDEIIHSLERSAYNHITATYYLLAERLLRKRSKMALEKGPPAPVLSPPNVLTPPRPKSPDLLTMNDHRVNLQKLLPDSPSSTPTTHLSPTSPQPTAPQPISGVAASAPSLPPPLTKRCSLIQEELEEEDEDMEVEKSSELFQPVTELQKNDADVFIGRGFEMDGRETDSQMMPSSVRPMSIGRPLSSILGEADGALQKFTGFIKADRSHQKRGQFAVRGTSCSSSDTSDTDEAPICQKPRREKTRHATRCNESGDRSSDTDAVAPLLSRKDRSRDSSREGLQEKARRLSCDMKRRLSIEEKRQSELIKEKRRNSISGTVKKSVSLILGQACVTRDNGHDDSFKLNTWNSCSDLSPNVNRAVNSGSLSSRHLADRTILGCILARELRLSRSEFLKESETLGRENRPRSRVIHVRSNDFSSLVDKFSSTVEEDAPKSADTAQPDRGLRQRSKGSAPKTDINRNALNSLNQSGDHLDSGEKPSTASTPAKTKCCSLV